MSLQCINILALALALALAFALALEMIHFRDAYGVVVRSSIFIRVRVGGRPRAARILIWSTIDQWGGDS